MVHFSKNVQSKILPMAGKFDLCVNFCDEEGKLGCKASSEAEMGMYSTRENVFNMSVDTGADGTEISSFVWTERGKPVRWENQTS